MSIQQWITARDHAFANGPVFRKPTGFLDAYKKTRSLEAARTLVLVWQQFEAGAELSEPLHLGLCARLINRNSRDAVSISGDTVLRGVLRTEISGRIRVGSSVYIGDGCILSAAENITIGDGTLLAHGVQIFDNDTHPTDPADRVADFRKKLGYRTDRAIAIGHAPVTIGSRCWLGLQSIVMKGVTIGDATIVASGSVVTTDLPSGVVAAGNPARPIKEITMSSGPITD